MRVWPLVALVASLPAAAGIFGGPPTRIPSPPKDFTAVVEDIGGIAVRVTSVSWNGEVHVWGDLGQAEISIPFEHVVAVTVGPAAEAHRRTLTVRTHHAEPVQILVDHDVPLYGKTAYGNYKIEIGDVGRLTLEGLTDR